MKPSVRINQVSEYYFSKKLAEVRELQAMGNNIINLGIGSPDLPPHSNVIEELNKTSQVEENNSYQSYRGIDELRNAFSQWYKRIYNVKLNPENEILPLIGSKEGIIHISMAFCNPGDRVLIPNPGYPTYTSVSKLLDLDIQYYNLIEDNNWLPDFTQLESLINDQCKIIWINFPHMPTGKVVDFETLKQLVSLAKSKNILLVNDNPYSLILNKNPISLLSYLSDYDNLIELNSLSKSHNMAGWRVGMLGGTEENINHILKVKSNFDSGMYKPVQLAAAKALNLEMNWYQKLNIEYSERKNLVWKILNSLECTYNENTSGLFVWAKIPNRYSDSYEFSDYLLYELGIFATPGQVFGSNGEKYIRFSLCASQAILNEALTKVETLKQKALCE
jgi:hypothetical protein